MSPRDLYEILGVPRNASVEDIRKAYRKIAMTHHPDRHEGGGSEAERKRSEGVFKEASSAYAVLSDPEQRARYDRYGPAGIGPGGRGGAGFQSVEDIFSAFSGIFGDSLFGGGFGGQGSRGASQGAHLQCEVAISLEEAAAGVTKTITLDRPEPCGPCHGRGTKPGSDPQKCPTCRGAGVVQQSAGLFMMRTTCPKCGGAGEIVAHPCPACRGRGRVMAEKALELSIPAGVEDGSRMRLAAQGEPGEKGGPRGDLYCLIHVAEHPFFRREGNDLLCEVPVSFVQAVLGATVEVPTLKGKGTVDIPRGTQPGEVLTLKGEGCPDLRGGRRGDLLIQVAVEIPKRLNREQEDLLRQYAAMADKAVGPRQKGFFDKLRQTFKEPELDRSRDGRKT